MSTIIAVSTQEEISRVATLAAEIWKEYYTPLIGAEQVAYMIERFQSAEVIKKAIEQDGYIYYLVCGDGDDIAYCGVLPEVESLFLSKIYVRYDHRGRGLARLMLDRALSDHLDTKRMWLTVNKGNAASIAAYERMGFVVEEAIVTDIGGGFVMDDFKMSCSIASQVG